MTFTPTIQMGSEKNKSIGKRPLRFLVALPYSSKASASPKEYFEYKVMKIGEFNAIYTKEAKTKLGMEQMMQLFAKTESIDWGIIKSSSPLVILAEAARLEADYIFIFDTKKRKWRWNCLAERGITFHEVD